MSPIHQLQKLPSSCTWKKEVPLNSVYNWANAGGGTSTVTCVSLPDKFIHIVLSGDFDATDKLIVWTLQVKIPWTGVSSAGVPGEFEVLELVWKSEQSKCEFTPCGENIPVSVSISGNAGYTDNPGIFNPAYWTTPPVEDILGYGCMHFTGGLLGGRTVAVGTYLNYFANKEGCITTGACCQDDGSCQELEKTACLELSGTFYPGGDCPGERLRPPGIQCPEKNKGACCLSNESCRYVTEAECRSLNGEWNEGKLCSDVTCDGWGACCNGTTCTIKKETPCTTGGGTYQGDGTTCADGPCGTDPTGACCYPDNSCTETTQANCQGAGGTYQGDGTTCATVTCGNCQKCRDPSSTPAGVTIIVSGFDYRLSGTCNCTDINGVYALQPTDENPCRFEYEKTCGGLNVVYSAEIGSPVPEIDNDVWMLNISYDGNPVIQRAIFFVPCEGGSGQNFLTPSRDGLCQGSTGVTCDLIV